MNVNARIKKKLMYLGHFSEKKIDLKVPELAFIAVASAGNSSSVLTMIPVTFYRENMR